MPFIIFAVKDIEAQFYERLNVYKWTGLSLFAIGLLVWAVLRIRSWFFESDESDVPTEEMISQFRQLKREGELSEEEFRFISQRLAGSRTTPEVSGAGSAESPAAPAEVPEGSTDPKDA